MMIHLLDGGSFYFYIFVHELKLQSFLIEEIGIIVEVDKKKHSFELLFGFEDIDCLGPRFYSCATCIEMFLGVK